MHVCLFETISLLLSHVHPRFAILEAGWRLLTIGDNRVLGKDLLILENLEVLCILQTASNPPEALNNESHTV